jgi:hypothetical protein
MILRSDKRKRAAPAIGTAMDQSHDLPRSARLGASPRLSGLVLAATLSACGDSTSTDDSLFAAPDASTSTVYDAAVGTGPTVDAGGWTGVVADAGTGTGTDASTGTGTGTDASTGTGTGTDASTGTGSGPTSCTIDATTSTSSTRYSGTYAVAVWIQDASNKAVKAFEAHSENRHATLRAYPSATNGVSGLDAVTGATVSGTINHHYTWDLKGPGGARVADGSYKLAVEVHSTTQNGTVYAPFTLGAAPVDASGTPSSDVKSIRIVCQ